MSIVDMLSKRMVSEFRWPIGKTLNKYKNHSVSQVVLVNAQYSIFDEDMETTCYFFPSMYLLKKYNVG